MGVTTPATKGAERSMTRVKLSSGKTASLGAVSRDGLVFGTYVHGFFDEPAIRDGLITWLCERKGIAPSTLITGEPANAGDPLDLLANHIAAHVDMATIEAWIA